jgi:hypothetical protein
MTILRPTLPRELISLIHHVELSKAGWWDRAVERMSMAVLWLLGGEATLLQVVHAFKGQIGVDVEATAVEGHFKSLVSKGFLVPVPRDRFKISEQALKELQRDLETSEANAHAARASFEARMAEHCPGLDATEAWAKLNDYFLVPLIQDVGARTYRLLSRDSPDIERTPQFSTFLEAFDPGCKDQLRRAVVTFLDPRDLAVRTYILSVLNGYFFLEAGNLPSATLSKVQELVAKPPQFAFFIDTNFLFSVLGFHENPSNEAAESLMRLVKELADRVAIRLYVYSLTLDEITRVFDWRAKEFRSRSIPPALARAALETGLTGLNKKLAEEAIRTGGAVSPEVFLQPYRTGLVQILRSKGIELFNADVSRLSMRQDVLDDVVGRFEFEKEKYKERAKSYDQVKHDVVLWYLAKERRPHTLDLPLEAGSWVVTVDYRLLGFDAYKRRRSSSKVPVCVHPSALVQMLQFWVPRSPQFEEAMLGALRLPLLLHEFDPSTEAITLKILEGLARFENASDISAETATSILTNEALRAKLTGVRDVDEATALVEGALVEHAERTRQQLEASEERARTLTAQTEAKEQAIGSMRAQAERTQSELVALKDSMAALMAERAADEARSDRRKVVAIAVTGMLLVVFAAGGVWWWQRSPRLTTVVACIALLLHLLAVDVTGRRLERIREWVWYSRFEGVRNLVYAFLGIVATAVIGEWAVRLIWPEGR